MTTNSPLKECLKQVKDIQQYTLDFKEDFKLEIQQVYKEDSSDMHATMQDDIKKTLQTMYLTSDKIMKISKSK